MYIYVYIYIYRDVHIYVYIYIYALLRSSRLQQAFFWLKKLRFRGSMTCISSVEVFSAAAGGFVSAKVTFSGFCNMFLLC